jgi:dephospho-CoA kinase
MVTIGLIGGVASGKSEVARLFELLGAARIDADRLGHEVLDEPEVRQALVKRWGPAIVDDSGRVDRRSVGRLVFGDAPGAAQELAYLEQITHPRIGAKLGAAIREAATRGDPAVVVDAAVMLKAGWDAHCDYVIFVDVPRDERLRRASQRGWTEAQFAAREAAQTPLDVKLRRADRIIDNAGPLEETFKQVKAIWTSLREPASRVGSKPD